MDRALLDRMRHWMFQEALPFWADKGLDRAHGGVVESFALDGVTYSGVDFKRARVAGRQLYVFSHAELWGWPGARAAADHVYDHFVSRFWQGPDKGWLRRVTMNGDALDATPDLYDYAFALFALGWRYKATQDAAALALAHQTLDLVERVFAHPSGLGFHAALPPSLPRQQNPHMHLMEAAIVLAEASGEPRFFALAETLSTLFTSHLCRRPNGALVEFFDDDWGPFGGDLGRRVEPGHQFEWAWILAQHQKLTGAPHTPIIQALVAWAERHGVDPQTHVTYNALDVDGVATDKASRTWPNTERLKGWIGLAEVADIDPWPAVNGSVRLLLDRYLEPAPRGAWIDVFDAEGRPTAKEIPTSTLYHLFLAFAEALRWSSTPAKRLA